MFPGLTGALGPCILSKVPVFGAAQSGRGLSFAEALETLWGIQSGLDRTLGAGKGGEDWREGALPWKQLP